MLIQTLPGHNFSQNFDTPRPVQYVTEKTKELTDLNLDLAWCLVYNYGHDKRERDEDIVLSF